MSVGMTLTTNGRNLLAKALTGKTLQFTRAFVGNGSTSKQHSAMTALVSPKMELPIQSLRTSSTGTAEVVLELNNQNLSKGFFVQEYGLFARDPDSNNEILYAYCTKGNEAPYLEGYDGTNPINYTLSIVTVIDQAQNVTATIATTNNYVTLNALNSRFTSLFADEQTPPAGFFTYANNDAQRLRPLTLAKTKKAIMDITDIPALVDRIERLEDAINELTLTLNVQEIYPGASHYMAEDFADPDTIDLFSAQITSIVAGDDSIDCIPVEGMLPGSWYIISDGIKSESVQVDSISLENGVQRVILKSTVKNTYKLTNCKIFRSSADIKSGSAYGSADKKNITWLPSITWKGQSSGATVNIPFDTSVSSSNSFTFTGNSILNSDGYITLGR